MFEIKSFYEAKDVADAINALVKNPDADIISGGTDVLIRVREGKDAGRSVVSIHNIEALKGVRLLDNGGLWIGAGTALSHIYCIIYPVDSISQLIADTDNLAIYGRGRLFCVNNILRVFRLVNISKCRASCLTSIRDFR